MYIDAPNPLPSLPPEPAEQPQARAAASAQVAQRAAESRPLPDELTQHNSSPSPLSVVVEVQNGDRMVYKFIDQASGEVVQQIPSEAMLRMAEAISSILQTLNTRSTADK